MNPMRRYLDLLVASRERRAVQGVPPPPVWRRLFHIVAGSSIPLAAIWVSETVMVWALAILASHALGLDLVRLRAGWLNALFIRWLAPLLKQDEATHNTGATYMLIAALVVYVLYGKEVAIPVMLFLSLGDPAAAIVGRSMPGPRILGKSPLGTAAFIGVGAGAVAVLVAADGIDRSGDRTLSRFSPMFGATFNPHRQLTLFANYTTAFQTPSTVELGNSASLEGGFNDDLDPETIHSVELGARGAFPVSSRPLDFGISLYRFEIDDILVPFQLADSEEVFFRNERRATNLGLELTASWAPTRTIRTDFSYTMSSFEYGSFDECIGGIEGGVAEECHTHENNDVPGMPQNHGFARLAYDRTGSASDAVGGGGAAVRDGPDHHAVPRAGHHRGGQDDSQLGQGSPDADHQGHQVHVRWPHQVHGRGVLFGGGGRVDQERRCIPHHVAAATLEPHPQGRVERVHDRPAAR